jgi:hypothetical protein
MTSKSSFVRAGLFVSGLLVALGAAALELAPYPQVFAGPKGIEVVLAPSTDGKEALMRVRGVNHPIDNVVFLGKSESRGGSTEAWVTPLDGRDWGLVQKRTSNYGGGERFEAYLPGQPDAVSLYYDEKKSRALKTTELQALYQRQQKDGVQDKLARFDKPKHLARARSGLEEIDATATASCGTPVKTEVDWASIDDDKLKRLSIPGYCGEVASQLDSMCRNDAAFKLKAASVGRVSCRFGDELRLRVDDRQVLFTTKEDAPNQGDFIRQFLRNQ